MDGVLKDLWVVALIDHLVHLVMRQSTQRQPVDIDRISFSAALRWLAAARDDERLITLVGNPPRPDRDGGRVRKRQPKPYLLMKTPGLELCKALVNHADTD